METTQSAIDVKILTQYEKQKVAIYKWRNKNIEAFHLKMHQYNKKHYENNREEKLQKVKAYQQKKREESGKVFKCVGRPSLYEKLINTKDNIREAG